MERKKEGKSPYYAIRHVKPSPVEMVKHFDNILRDIRILEDRLATDFDRNNFNRILGGIVKNKGEVWDKIKSQMIELRNNLGDYHGQQKVIGKIKSTMDAEADKVSKKYGMSRPESWSGMNRYGWMY